MKVSYRTRKIFNTGIFIIYVLVPGTSIYKFIHHLSCCQAHPDKKLAERLYATRPDLYKDDNHKPEMAVALSDFEGLCGFRPFEEIVFNLHRYPELRGLVSLSAMRAMCSLPEDLEDRRDALRKLFHSYITAKPEVVTSQVNALVQRLGSRVDESGFSSDGSVVSDNFFDINRDGRWQCRESVGASCAFFLRSRLLRF